MEIIIQEINNIKIAEIQSEACVVNTIEEGKDLIGDVYYQGCDGLILEEKQLHPDFFDLKTKFAGELLQKFSNYKVRLAIVGDFSQYESKSMKDFIYESNKQGLVFFVDHKEQAFKKLSNER